MLNITIYKKKNPGHQGDVDFCIGIMILVGKGNAGSTDINVYVYMRGFFFVQTKKICLNRKNIIANIHQNSLK